MFRKYFNVEAFEQQSRGKCIICLARAHVLRNFIKTFRFYQNLESDQEGGKETGFMYTRNFSVKQKQIMAKTWIF